MNPIIKTALYLVSKPYGWYMSLRNFLYDSNTIKSDKSTIPSIGIGNITVGGTGKTPHSEYIIELLKDKFQVAYLSRGYKRKTRGWRDTSKDVSAKTIGDEPYQIYSKYPDVTVAVCENRLKGVENLKKHYPNTQIVVLDDVYQHRSISPDLNILLIDYNRLTYYDHLIPLGRLREKAENTDRAEIIIITKCPEDFRPVDCLSVRTKIRPLPFQKLIFGRIVYKNLEPIYNTPADFDTNDKTVIAVSGLAHSDNYFSYLKTLSPKVINVKHPDHHNYAAKDIANISKIVAEHPNSIVVITEKDKAKFDSISLPYDISNRIFCLGIKVDFIFDGKKELDNHILNFAGKLIKGTSKNSPN